MITGRLAKARGDARATDVPTEMTGEEAALERRKEPVPTTTVHARRLAIQIGDARRGLGAMRLLVSRIARWRLWFGGLARWRIVLGDDGSNVVHTGWNDTQDHEQQSSKPRTTLQLAHSSLLALRSVGMGVVAVMAPHRGRPLITTVPKTTLQLSSHDSPRPIDR